MNLQANAIYVSVRIVMLHEVHFQYILLKIKAVYFLHRLPTILRHFTDQWHKMGSQIRGYICLTTGASNGPPGAISRVANHKVEKCPV